VQRSFIGIVGPGRESRAFFVCRACSTARGHRSPVCYGQRRVIQRRVMSVAQAPEVIVLIKP
jgi:hypothetical protein